MVDNRVEARLSRMERALARIEDRETDIVRILRALAGFTAEREVELMATIDDVVAAVQNETTVVASVGTLLAQLTALLQEAQAAGDPAKIQQALDLIAQNTQSLSDAVTANTPAA